MQHNPTGLVQSFGSATGVSSTLVAEPCAPSRVEVQGLLFFLVAANILQEFSKGDDVGGCERSSAR